jgi:hypothetical protein
VLDPELFLRAIEMRNIGEIREELLEWHREDSRMAALEQV